MITVTVARKPLSASIVANIRNYGTSCLNIDSCRIDGDTNYTSTPSRGFSSLNLTGARNGYRPNSYQSDIIPCGSSSVGRWPSNVILVHDHHCRKTDGGCTCNCPISQISVQSGIVSFGNKKGGYSYSESTYTVKGFVSTCKPNAPSNYGDSGGASRFFKQVWGL
jgi:site-specific DNA-methyltransferase (adenine-specific)